MALIEIPEDPTLSQIVEALRQHQTDFPTHGVACACADSVIRSVRNGTTVSTLQERLDDSDLWQLQSRIDYVLICAQRRY